MNEEQAAVELLPFAKRVARRLWHDSESESVAGLAVLIAIRTYDGRIPLRRWVARCVRIETWHYWRKLKVRAPWSAQAPDEAWEYVISFDEPVGDCPLDSEMWQILCEKYVEQWAEDVIAKRRGLSVYRVRKIVEEATELLEAYVRS